VRNGGVRALWRITRSNLSTAAQTMHRTTTLQGHSRNGGL
jgi:hypothetical protein